MAKRKIQKDVLNRIRASLKDTIEPMLKDIDKKLDHLIEHRSKQDGSPDWKSYY